MEKKRTLLIIFVVLALALVSSCAPSAEEAAAPDPSDSEQEAVAEEMATPVPETEEEESEPIEEEEVSLDQVTDVDVLDSYRQTVTVRVQEGDGELEEMTYTIQAVREPPARHMVMSSLDKEGASQHFYEMIQIGSTQYMRTSSEEDSWMTVAGDEELSAEESMGDMVGPGTDQFMDDEACEMVGTETVSGLETRHYRCDLDVIEEALFAFTEAESNVWISTRHNLPVKIQARYAGTDSEGQEMLWETEQLLDMINEPMDIQPPEGVSETGLPDDIPLIDSATGVSTMGAMVVFETPETVEAVTEFYKEEMPKEGWTEDEDQGPIPGYFGFTKGDRAVSFMISGEEDSPSNVMITLQE